jgi:hypothetical protein
MARPTRPLVDWMPDTRPTTEHWFKPSFVTAALAGVAVAVMLVSYMVGALLG